MRSCILSSTYPKFKLFPVFKVIQAYLEQSHVHLSNIHVTIQKQSHAHCSNAHLIVPVQSHVHLNNVHVNVLEQSHVAQMCI